MLLIVAASGAHVTPAVSSRSQFPAVAQVAHLPVEVADWLAWLADELLAPATRCAYRSAVRLWAEYAASVGATAMPPDAGALLAHVKALADGGASLSRIRLLAAALAKAGAYASIAKYVPPSVRIAIGALAAKRGRRGAEPKQAVGVRADALLSVAMAAQRPRPRGRGVESDALAERRAALDVAIVLVMRDGLLRVSECAALVRRGHEPGRFGHRRRSAQQNQEHHHGVLRAGDGGRARQGAHR